MKLRSSRNRADLRVSNREGGEGGGVIGAVRRTPETASCMATVCSVANGEEFTFLGCVIESASLENQPIVLGFQHNVTISISESESRCRSGLCDESEVRSTVIDRRPHASRVLGRPSIIFEFEPHW